MLAKLLTGADRKNAEAVIKSSHYSKSIPSGKSHYIAYGCAIVVWSIPANKNLANFIIGHRGNVWELSRLWAPDNHEKNLLTQAISEGVRIIRALEKPEALVSYADPNVGHSGGIYRAASWVYHGQSEESRYYIDKDGNTVSRRAFHSGKRGMKKADILAMGYEQHKRPGKYRFVKGVTLSAKRYIESHNPVENQG